MIDTTERSTSPPLRRVRARNVVVAAGTLGTLRLLFHCRDISRSLPNLSPRLGDMVRTNSEALLGVVSRNLITNYSEGIAITSIFYADPVTTHILGGCPFGRDAQEGVIDLDCQAHNYPHLYIVDGSIVPANPGVNPSLTIAALAEYAMSRTQHMTQEEQR